MNYELYTDLHSSSQNFYSILIRHATFFPSPFHPCLYGQSVDGIYGLSSAVNEKYENLAVNRLTDNKIRSGFMFLSRQL